MECKFQNCGTFADVAYQNYKIWNSTGNALVIIIWTKERLHR